LLLVGPHLDTTTGTPDLSGSRAREPKPCRINPAFRLAQSRTSVVVSRCALSLWCKPGERLITSRHCGIDGRMSAAERETRVLKARPFTTESIGRVESLHLHPQVPGAPLESVTAIDLVQGKGIVDNPRYYGRISRDRGQPSKRQVTLIEREQVTEHAAKLGLQTIPPGAVRSNIETSGIDLVALVGREIE